MKITPGDVLYLFLFWNLIGVALIGLGAVLFRSG